MEKFFKIIFAVKKSGKINLLLIILLLVNGAYMMGSDFYAEPGEFPYVVSVWVSDVHLCTGTIIDETHILTIAHVFLGKYKFQLTVVAGVIMITHPFTEMQKFPVEKIYLHSGLTRVEMPGVEGYWKDDIAIIKLAKRFQWSTYCGPVQFRKEEINWMSCPDCRIIYWKNPQQERKDILVQKWDFVVDLSDERCYERNIIVLRNQKCFSDFLNTLLITSEDLGSPIICDNLMVGFVARKTDNVVAGTPSTFLQTLPYLDFIRDVLAEGLVDVGPADFPYVVSIWYDNRYICGGLILDSTHILTTAHCVWGLEQAQLRIVAGYFDVSRQNVAVDGLPVRNITFHELYKLRFLIDENYWFTEHDIAVVVLAGPVILAPTSDILENIRDASHGLLCNSFHWRHGENISGMKMMKLKKAGVIILSDELCKSMLETQEMPRTFSQFCARNQHHIQTADYRDCGNPIISEGKPVGMLVRAFPMDDRSPSIAVFLWLHPYKDFIRSAMSES